MAIYHLQQDQLVAAAETNFDAESIHERRDLQRLLKENIGVLDERLMVIAEEFGDWLDSARRIDLLCLDADANLVVVELKRSEDGGFMELQALRYAAMVSAMTFDQLIETHARYLRRIEPDFEAAKATVLKFLNWDEVKEEQFGDDTKVILASADFSKELTTSVMWLRDNYSVDIRCVRLKPYRLEQGQILLDVQQLIPLPEAASFQTQIGVKRQSEKKHKKERHDLRFRFWEGLLGYAKSKTQIHANRKPSQDGWISGGIGRSGFSLTYSVRQTDCQVELWIAFGTGQAIKNKIAFNELLAQQIEIEQDFDNKLEWQELPDGDGCRIRFILEGGYKSSPDTWPEIHFRMVDAMTKLDLAMRNRVQALKIEG